MLNNWTYIFVTHVVVSLMYWFLKIIFGFEHTAVIFERSVLVWATAWCTSMSAMSLLVLVETWRFTIANEHDACSVAAWNRKAFATCLSCPFRFPTWITHKNNGRRQHQNSGGGKNNNYVSKFERRIQTSMKSPQRPLSHGCIIYGRCTRICLYADINCTKTQILQTCIGTPENKESKTRRLAEEVRAK